MDFNEKEGNIPVDIVPWQKELFSIDAELLYYPEREIILNSNESSIVIETNCNDTATTLWDSEVVLAHYLDEEIGPKLLQNSKVIELGAGTGGAGCTAAVLGATVLLTDLECTIEFLRRNALRVKERFPKSSINVEPLDWFDSMNKDNNYTREVLDNNERSSYDILLLSDCIYREELYDALIHTIIKINPKYCLVSFQHRRKDYRPFFSCLEKFGFETEELHCPLLDSAKLLANVYIWKCSYKKSSVIP